MKLAEKKRPTGVTALAVLGIIVGFLNLMAGLFLSSSDLATAWLALGAIDWLIRGIFILMGIVALVLAYGL